MMMASRKKLYAIIVILYQITCSQCSNGLGKSSGSIKNDSGFMLANRETLLMRGHSTNFTNGYMDGCRSGQYTAGDKTSYYIQDKKSATINSEYLLGWEQGHAFCYEHMRNLIKNSNHTSSYKSKEAIEFEKQRIWSELRK